MAYLKQSWNTGDTITAKKLNHIEKGIEDNVVNRVHVDYDSSLGVYYLDRNYSEITTYFYKQGFVPLFMYTNSNKTQEACVGFIALYNYSVDTFMVAAVMFNADASTYTKTFTSEAEDGRLVEVATT